MLGKCHQPSLSSSIFFNGVIVFIYPVLLEGEYSLAFNFHINWKKEKKKGFHFLASLKLKLTQHFRTVKILLQKDLLCRDYKVSVIHDTCILYSCAGLRKRNVKKCQEGLRKAQLSCSVPLWLPLQSAPVLQMSALYLKLPTRNT